MRKKNKKDTRFNINQKSFFFEDYLETNLKQKNLSKSNISEDRIYILFFFFFSLISIFAIKIAFISFQEPQFLEKQKTNLNFLSLRRDIVDRNGVLISRNIKTYHAAIRPKLIKDKEKLLINIKINFPEIDQKRLRENLLKNKYFYLKKRLTDEEKNKLLNLDCLILNALRHDEHYSHINLKEALQIIHDLKPKKAYLTHIAPQMGFHGNTERLLPKSVFLAYDGLEIEIYTRPR